MSKRRRKTKQSKKNDVISKAKESTKNNLKGIENITFFHLIKDVMKKRYKGVKVFSYSMFFLSLYYFVTPYDFLADYLIGIGLLDDAVIFSVFIYRFKKEMSRYIYWKNNSYEMR